MDLGKLSECVIEGDSAGAEELARRALEDGVDAVTIVNEGLVPGMNVVGERFKSFEYYLPEVLISARAMKAAMAVVSPLLAQQDGASSGKVVIGTVRGDLHDIGKNLVAMMLEGAGFEIVDLGTDVSPEEFARAVEEHRAEMLCISALLTTTMPVMKDVVDLLEANELRQRVKVIVGGAPVTERYALDIGADGYAPEAASAVETAKDLLGMGAPRPE